MDRYPRAFGGIGLFYRIKFPRRRQIVAMTTCQDEEVVEVEPQLILFIGSQEVSQTGVSAAAEYGRELKHYCGGWLN